MSAAIRQADAVTNEDVRADASADVPGATDGVPAGGSTADVCRELVRLVAARRVRWLRQLWSTSMDASGDWGTWVAIGHAEVDRILTDPARMRAAEAAFFATDATAVDLQAAIDAATERLAADPRWVRMIHEHELSKAEQDVVALAVAAEIEPALTRVYGYFEDDTAARWPTTALAAAVFAWPDAGAIGVAPHLVIGRMAAPLDPASDPSLPATAWRAAPAWVRWLRGLTDEMPERPGPSPMSPMSPMSVGLDAPDAEPPDAPDLPGGDELLIPLPCPYTWDDIVLNAPLREHLAEFESQASWRDAVYGDWGFADLVPLGRGITALFAGPSGTGKTMAAQVIARSIGLPLLRVDLAGVVNKYIGETEKRLRQVFDACERDPVMLLFDEADALFGKRTQVRDAHDRFANIEIDYLLQRMEQFDGIAVLATNRRNDLDTAFVRRVRFIIDFVTPGPPERLRIWHLALPERTRTGEPLLSPTDAIHFERLAHQLELTGAEIKLAALAAAFLARADGTRIGMGHVVHAVRRELRKRSADLRLDEWSGP